MTETFSERTFLAVYGSPALQAAVGIDEDAKRPLRKAGKNPLHQELLQKRIAELKSQIPIGGLREALIRALLYAGMGRSGVDERGFESVRRIRQEYTDISLPAFKTLVREQFNMLLIDTEAALTAIPSMLPAEPELRLKAFNLLKQVLSASGDLSAADRERIQRVAKLFGVDEKAAAVQTLSVVASNRKQSKAS
jgi:uncharacterized tellurite resistance protein B-like protein